MSTCESGDNVLRARSVPGSAAIQLHTRTFRLSLYARQKSGELTKNPEGSSWLSLQGDPCTVADHSDDHRIFSFDDEFCAEATEEGAPLELCDLFYHDS